MTSPIVTLVLFLSLSILTNGRRQERVCLQLESVEDVYGENRAEVQTIPGKKGPKGDKGFPGLKGSQAEVDYDELEALINRNVERAMEKQRAEMNETMDELLDRIEELEGHFPPPGFTEQDILRYDGRIFIPLASERVLKASAIVKCQQLGGELANIYTQIHMDKIMTFIRDNKLDGQIYKDFHLGMIYDPINQILRFQNETVTSYRDFKWYPGYPFNEQRFRHKRMNNRSVNNPLYVEMQPDGAILPERLDIDEDDASEPTSNGEAKGMLSTDTSDLESR
ncbi:uncharacterized protein LOC120329440 [Styela clava]